MRKSSLKIHKVGDLIGAWDDEDEIAGFIPIYGIITREFYVQHKDRFEYEVYWMNHRFAGIAPRRYQAKEITEHKKNLNAAVDEVIYK